MTTNSTGNYLIIANEHGEQILLVAVAVIAIWSEMDEKGLVEKIKLRRK